MIGAKIIGGGGKRFDFDFYPTPKEVTVALLDFLKLPPITIWECACGEMAISSVLQDYGHTVISTDIIYGNDFFKTQYENIDAIITNPPFRFAEKFIRKALIDAPLVAMLLKTQYFHAAKRSELFLAHPPAFILALTWRPDFFGKQSTGGGPTMDFIWSVWKQGEPDTRYRILKKPIFQL